MTLAKVAKSAGVAIMTASKVFKNDPTVRSYIRARVLEAAKELNYRPNCLARGLRSKSSNIVTIGIQTTENPYFGTLAGEITRRLMDAGLAGVLCNNTGRVREINQVACACGTILVAPNQAMIRELLQDSPKLVTVTSHNALPDDAPEIGIDFATAYAGLAQYLRDCGRTRIGYYAPEQEWGINYSCKFRYLHEALGQPEPAGGKRFFSAAEAVAQALRKQGSLNCLCATNDMQAVELMVRAQSAGLRVPQDLLVVGCDGTLMLPGLCTLQIDLPEVASRAFLALQRLLAGEKVATPPLLEPVLIRSL